ncbi:hypothetical protein H5410_013365 [Solanum commersonii]|uniref:DUF3444 domain-containing protein n=1 Tax=Solanum commersonii TaxID=4109 RepID=A0A9J6AV64_SOLCO|nr:hypothetical protein H5410_013365 [Solanum commersonii]
MKEVEDVSKQQIERVIAFPYQILGSALAPLGMTKIQNLEPEPLSEDETKWLSQEFLASCARFSLGNLEDIEDIPMFSHLVCSMNGNNCYAIKIFPLEGET